MPLKLGRLSYIDSDKFVNVFDVDVTVGNYTSIAQTFTVVGNRGQHSWVWDRKRVTTYELSWRLPVGDKFPIIVRDTPISIGHDVWIGADVCILGGVTVGNGAIIGARSVVSKDVPPYAVVVGSDNRIVHYRYTPEQIAALQRIQWWDWHTDDIVKNVESFHDIDAFIAKFDTKP